MSTTGNDSDIDKVPSYEEAIASDTNLAKGQCPRPSLHSQLEKARSRRIENLLTEHIDPILVSQGWDGLYKTILILIPSDHEDKVFSEKGLVGVPSSVASIQVIQLKGQDNRSLFYQQTPVIRDLEASLKIRLTSLGHNIEDLSQTADKVPTTSPTSLAGPESKNRPAWPRKKIGASEEGYDPTRSTSHWKGGWRADDEVQSKKLSPDETRAVANIREVSFRSENEMGLLCTETVKALWIAIEVGS